MNAKKVWSLCRKQRAEAIAKKSSPHPSTQNPKEPDPGSIDQARDDVSPSLLQAKLGLQEAVIFSLKKTYSNVESDSIDLKAKIDRLQKELAHTNARLFNLRDYDEIKRKSILGFDAGFELGQREVQRGHIQ